MSFRIALSGLNAATTDLSVISNNIANSNTTGFKSSDAQFADVFASGALDFRQDQVGNGVRLAAIAQSQTQGNVEFTGGNGETFRTASQSETLARYGAGLDFDFTPNLGMRLEWERYANVGKKFEVGQSGTTGEADMDNLSLSVVYRFR